MPQGIENPVGAENPSPVLENSALAPELPRLPSDDMAQPLCLPRPGPKRPGGKVGAVKGDRSAEKHGVRTRKRRAFDSRRGIDRKVLATVRVLEQSLGGVQMSPQRALILAGTAIKLRDVAKIEAWEAKVLKGDIVVGRGKITPATELKLKLLASIAADLKLLGLDRVKQAPRSLSDVLNAYEKAPESPSAEPEPEPDAPAD